MDGVRGLSREDSGECQYYYKVKGNADEYESFKLEVGSMESESPRDPETGT
jgi:hypothetical protein